MRISAPGTEEGFTLVELMIVLVIVSLMSTVVMLSLPDPRGSLTQEATRFAARAKAAQERAVIDARATSVRVTDIGYGFDERRQSEWRPLANGVLADQRWSDGTEVGIGSAAAARIVFDSTGAAEAARLVLSRDGEQVTINIAYDGSIHVGA